jgi:hypothetical protein
MSQPVEFTKLNLAHTDSLSFVKAPNKTQFLPLLVKVLLKRFQLGQAALAVRVKGYLVSWSLCATLSKAGFKVTTNYSQGLRSSYLRFDVSIKVATLRPSFQSPAPVCLGISSMFTIKKCALTFHPFQ